MATQKPNNVDDSQYQDLLHESELVVAFVRMALAALTSATVQRNHSPFCL